MAMAMREHWHELWGTFSVQDHGRPGAFVAEVLLFDKLVIPVPATARDGLGPADALREIEHWKASGWNPRRQQQLLAILGDRAQPIPWSAGLQAQWQSRMRDEFDQASRDGYFMTGSVLQQFVPAMAKPLVAVSRYHSIAELDAAGIRRRDPGEKLPASTLLAVLGHEFLLPDDPMKDDFDLLRRAVEVAGDPGYRIKRRALHEWQQDFVTTNTLTDAASIKGALAHMQTLVDDLKSATAEQRKWKFVKRFFSFVGFASKGAALAGPAFAVPAVGAGLAASFGAFAVDEATRRSPDAGMPAATLIVDAREKLDVE